MLFSVYFFKLISLFLNQIKMQFVGFVCSFFIFSFSAALAQGINMEWQQVNLADAIAALAKFLAINVLINPEVTGSVTLELQNAKPENVLDLLLTTHGLSKWRVGNVWVIGLREQFIKRQQEELQWQEINAAIAPLFWATWHIKYANAEEIAHFLQEGQTALLSKRGKLRVDKRTNVICILDTEEQLRAIERVIRCLDVPVQQLSIRVRMVSIDHDYEQELGLHFAVSAEHGMGAIREGSYSLAVAKLADGSWLDIKLAALENAGHADLISTPSLFTANQQEAKIEAGEEVPYQEVSESGGTAVTFKKAVLGLKVTPQVLPGEQVMLQLEINQDRPSNRMVQGVPTINTRAITSHVLIKNGHTIVLGGIVENNQENGEQRVPLLGRLPVIGRLFVLQHKRTSKRELLIFVTPTIIKRT
jgi:type IV pilus assembly protein PilQ